MHVLGIVPARGGSKGIPRKNLLFLAQRPLLSYTIEAAQDSGVIDTLILSTDSEEIAAVGKSLGILVPFLRPGELAQDDTAMLPVIKHAVGFMEHEQEVRPTLIAILQPTAPLRNPEHIQSAVFLIEDKAADSVVSVTEVPSHYSPEYVMKIENGLLVNYLEMGADIGRRQDANKAYSRDGTIYLIRRDILMETNSLYGTKSVPLIIPMNQSINLDSPDDWERAERLLAMRS